MVTYNCSECNKTFNHRNDYMRHINRKSPCNKNGYFQMGGSPPEISKAPPKLSKIEKIIEKESYICFYCKNEFSNKYNLNRHINLVCKVKKQHEKEKEDKYNELLQRIENNEKKFEDKITNLENQLREEKEKNNKFIQMNTSDKTINNSKNCNINNIENQNITLNLIAHGREDLDKIDVKYILEALKRGISSIPVITERIHFNVKYPEYQNVYITNMNQKYGMIYDGKEWKLKDKDTIIEDLYEKKYDFLDENFENIYNQLSDSQQKAFKRFLDIHDKADTNKQFKKIIDKIKQDLKFLLYNNKKMPIDTFNCYRKIQEEEKAEEDLNNQSKQTVNNIKKNIKYSLCNKKDIPIE